MEPITCKSIEPVTLFHVTDKVGSSSYNYRSAAKTLVAGTPSGQDTEAAIMGSA